jgi:hypothetical protein
LPSNPPVALVVLYPRLLGENSVNNASDAADSASSSASPSSGNRDTAIEKLDGRRDVPEVTRQRRVLMLELEVEGTILGESLRSEGP